AATNNHGTWYDAQVASFAMFAGRKDLAQRVLAAAAEKRIASQFEPDGRQPLELARTKSFSYSAMNLQGMFTLAGLGQQVGVDLWNFRTDDGRCLRKAMDYLVPFADGKAQWQHEQIGGVHPDLLYPLLRRAGIAYREPGYEMRIAEIAGLDRKSERLELVWPAP
ncbi:MAG: alginate lyase family protein, partial [Thermoguttaceae bacterium]